MAEEKKEVRYDVDGSDVLTNALLELINQYPGVMSGDEISFATLGETSGKSMFPVSGAVIETEKTTVTGHVMQVCRYPCCVVYRAKGLSENRKIAVKEWLDNLGRWLERQEITIDGEQYRLNQYPPLTGKRKLLSISRQEPGHLESETDDHTEDWVIRLSARYENEFYKNK